MTIFSFILLGFSFFFSWLNVWSLGYLGVFFLNVISLIISVMLVWWELYTIWFYSFCYGSTSFLWAELGNNILIYIGFKIDFFSVVTAFVMISGSLFVFLFVFIDMWNDKDGIFFFIELGFFLIFMLITVLSDNLIFFYLGWEGIGLTSLFLINFWSERVRSLKASFKVFIINKFGDFFILILICFLLGYLGTGNFDEINFLAYHLVNYNFLFGSWKCSFIEFIGIILVLGSSIKSAQYGFHIWLLEAMEAPLGASALMHSSTLVIAGLVLSFKLVNILELSSCAQLMMFTMGIFSAFCGSLIACFQYELKVVMAYSTISNMGYLFVLCSLGAYFEMLIVMVLHAYIKIFLFLVVGGIILHCNGCQDIRWMGGLFIYTPVLFLAYFVGAVCLSGLPYWSGYYCKYYICEAVFNNSSILIGGEIILMYSYFLTIIYVFRLGYLVFFNSKNGHKSIYKVKYNSLLFTFDLIILGFIILFFGTFWVNLMDVNYYSLSSYNYFKILITFKYLYYQLSYYSVWLWSLIYSLIYILFFFFNFFNISQFWNFFYFWYIYIWVFFLFNYFFFLL